MYVFVFMSLCVCTSLYSHTFLSFYIRFDDEYSQVYIAWGKNALIWTGMGTHQKVSS